MEYSVVYNIVLILFFVLLVLLVKQFLRLRKTKANLVSDISFLKTQLREITGDNIEGSKIPSIKLDDFDDYFDTNQFGPKLTSQVSFIGSGSLGVPGGTSDTEAWVLSVLAKKAESMFEFGTCTGKTAYLWAINSSKDAKVFTLTLPPTAVNNYKVEEADNPKAFEHAVSESAFSSFIYTDTPAEVKITQIFCDSKEFDETKYLNTFDLIFIDGSHAYSYIKSDTEKALMMLKEGGIIIWHDYRSKTGASTDVFKYLNELRDELPLVHISGTCFVAFRKH